MIHPGAGVHTDKPRTEWRVKSVFHNGVVITVSSENLEKLKQEKMLLFRKLLSSLTKIRFSERVRLN